MRTLSIFAVLTLLCGSSLASERSVDEATALDWAAQAYGLWHTCPRAEPDEASLYKFMERAGLAFDQGLEARIAALAETRYKAEFSRLKDDEACHRAIEEFGPTGTKMPSALRVLRCCGKRRWTTS